MLKKSNLLDYLVTGADEMRKKDGRRALSANYFIVSLLKALKDNADGDLAEELNDESTKKELRAAGALLDKYRFDRDETIASIERFVTSSEYRSSMDEFMYSKLLYNAEEKAKADGADRLDAPLYLRLVLAEPTDAIKKYIMASDTEQGTQQTISVQTETKEALADRKSVV